MLYLLYFAMLTREGGMKTLKNEVNQSAKYDPQAIETEA
jgi:hypothetical protein